MSEYKYRVSLFYSYCHKDEAFRERMEVALALLRDNNHLTEWSDRKISPGSKLLPKTLKELNRVDLVAYLVSPDFLNSQPCKDEWRRAKKNAEESGQRLIPVIVRKCPWKDFDTMGEHLAIPRDGKPITQWSDEDEAWNDVYEQMKMVLEEIRSTFEVRKQFRSKISKVEFISQNQENIRLEDLFVFPHLVLHDQSSFDLLEKRIVNIDELLDITHAFIKGDDQSGKTTLCRKLFLRLAEEGEPALLVDLDEIGRKVPRQDFFHEMYAKQMQGDYELWEKSPNKTIILDNLTSQKIGFLTYAQDHFDRIYVTTSNDIYTAFFRDDKRLAQFRQVRILTLGHSSQEELIRKWTQLDPAVKSNQGQLTDGKIDQLERNVNSIMHDRIVPRYPFFVLSILQTYEGYLPHDLKISAYGHCYHALIAAHLYDSGIVKEQIDSCFNFLARLAYEIRLSSGERNSISERDFELFENQYREEFLELWDSTRRRLFDQPNSILSVRNQQVCFSWPYSYYFFLGLYLSGHYQNNVDLISNMVEKSYVRDNSLTLIFVIHHSQNAEIIDEVLIHTMYTIDWRKPVKLDLDEITVFEDILRQLSVDYPSDNTHVGDGRLEERNQRDVMEAEPYESIEESPHQAMNDIYRALKNMDILSQILKNKHGSIEKARLAEMIETIVDTGLKLASVFLCDKSELDELAKMVKAQLEEGDGVVSTNENAIRTELTRFVFALVMNSIEKAVSSIDTKEVRQVVRDLCEQKATPAYDLVYSFYSIDVAESFSNSQLSMVRQMLKKHRKNYLVTRALPIRIGMYLTTHRVSDPIRSALRAQLKSLTGSNSRLL